MKSSIAITGAVGLLATQSWLAAEPPILRADDVTAVVPVKNPYEGDPLRAAQGRSLFNQYCAHCHAPNALSPDPLRICAA
jgi:mono/diheme cytochrome c family protein